MLVKDKITEIFFTADDFCKIFDEMLHRTNDRFGLK